MNTPDVQAPTADQRRDHVLAWLRATDEQVAARVGKIRQKHVSYLTSECVLMTDGTEVPYTEAERLAYVQMKRWQRTGTGEPLVIPSPALNVARAV